MHVIKIDGFSFEVQDPNAQAAVDRAIENVRKAGETATASEKMRADNADKLCAEVRKTLSELQAKYDGLAEKVKADEGAMTKCDECGGSGKIDGAECKGCSGKGEFAKKADTAERRESVLARIVDRKVEKRAALIAEARRHLGANEKFDGKSDIEIKRLVVGKLKPTAVLTGQNDDYVNARYDGAIEDAGGRKPVDDVLVGVTQPPVVDPNKPAPRADELPSTDPDQARKNMIARQLNANVKAPRRN